MDVVVGLTSGGVEEGVAVLLGVIDGVAVLVGVDDGVGGGTEQQSLYETIVYSAVPPLVSF